MLRPKGDPMVQGLAEGREEAFAAVYDRFGPALFRVAWALLGARADAEDAVQEVFVGLVRARRTLGEVENLRAYLFAGLRHAAAKLAAQRRTQGQVAWQDLVQVAAAQPRASDPWTAVGPTAAGCTASAGWRRRLLDYPVLPSSRESHPLSG